MAKRKADGESLGEPEFGEKSRTRVFLAFGQSLSDEKFRAVVERAHAAVLFEEGELRLRGKLSPYEDFVDYIQDCGTDEFASCIEALLDVVKEATSYGYLYGADLHNITSKLKEVLRSDQLTWELSDDYRMSPFKSQELQQEVVAPAQTLLSNRKGWEKVEKTYQNALGKLGDDPAGAITAAGTALQEALRAAGATGRNLSALFKDAHVKALLGPSDAALSDSINKALDWASANRNQRGDTHAVSDADKADAWLMVHVIGALIVWLADKSDQV